MGCADTRYRLVKILAHSVGKLASVCKCLHYLCVADKSFGHGQKLDGTITYTVGVVVVGWLSQRCKSKFRTAECKSQLCHHISG